MAWPWNNSNSPAEYCRPQKRVSKENTYISSPTDWRSSTISQPQRGWFSQERRPEIKFLYQRVEVHRASYQRTECPYPRKWWDSFICPLYNDSLMWIVLSHDWLHKNRGEWSSQTQLMITTNCQFSWKHNAVEYLWDTVTNPHFKCQGLMITT